MLLLAPLGLPKPVQETLVSATGPQNQNKEVFLSAEEWLVVAVALGKQK